MIFLFYIFRGNEFQIHQVYELFDKYTLETFFKIHENYKTKVIVIDSAEKLLNIANQDPFKDFITTFYIKRMEYYIHYKTQLSR